MAILTYVCSHSLRILILEAYFLLACSRRKTLGTTTGTLLYDGRYPSTRTIKRETAYVQQHDALHGKTTVQEVLMFAAMMKLRVPNEVRLAHTILITEQIRKLA